MGLSPKGLWYSEHEDRFADAGDEVILEEAVFLLGRDLRVGDVVLVHVRGDGDVRSGRRETVPEDAVSLMRPPEIVAHRDIGEDVGVDPVDMVGAYPGAEAVDVLPPVVVRVGRDLVAAVRAAGEVVVVGEVLREGGRDRENEREGEAGEDDLQVFPVPPGVDRLRGEDGYGEDDREDVSDADLEVRCEGPDDVGIGEGTRTAPRGML